MRYPKEMQKTKNKKQKTKNKKQKIPQYVEWRTD